MRNRLIPVGLILISACGGGSSTPSSGSPTTPTVTNRPPVITSATVTPANGISTLTTHSFSVAANDPDGDALTYSWDFGNGTGSSSASAAVTYNNADTFTYQAAVTVRDSKGESATAKVSVTSVTITGTFKGTLSGTPLVANLTQYLGGVVQGTWQMPSLGFSGDVGPTGELGKIFEDGRFELRFKVKQGSFNDFYYRGNIDPTGQHLTGSLQGSGFTGQLMYLDKQ